MDLPSVFFALRWLARDTFRQARSSGVTVAMTAATLVCFGLCLTVTVRGDSVPLPGEPGEPPNILPAKEAATMSGRDLEGVEVPGGEMSLLFGKVRIPLKRDRATEVRFIELVMTGGVADTLGVLLALVWTAGFLPSCLDPTTASVLFAKPLPRGLFLAGKSLGVLLLLAGQATLFIAGVWAALGVRTGVWDARVFVAIPVLVLHFACFYAVSAALAVAARSTVVCVIGTVLFWAVCCAVNVSRQAGAPSLAVETAYWLLPKPADFGLLLVNVLGAHNYFGDLRMQGAAASFSPEVVVLTSCFVPAVALCFAHQRLKRAAY
jgi:hypothetical protein